jgi:hypothetical protein
MAVPNPTLDASGESRLRGPSPWAPARATRPSRPVRHAKHAAGQRLRGRATAALVELRHGPRRPHRNRVSPEIEERMLDLPGQATSELPFAR